MTADKEVHDDFDEAARKLDGAVTPVTLLQELRIEAALVPNRRGKLYALAADRIEELEKRPFVMNPDEAYSG